MMMKHTKFNSLFHSFAQAKQLLQNYQDSKKRFLCAVSGGLDSMCLLHFLHTWGREQGFLFSAAHFNHHLRETADRDENFVQQICHQWEIECVTGSGDVQLFSEQEGYSIEEAARILRYDFLRQTARNLDCEIILTAHHANDLAETVLLNLIRGSGIKGLTGIPVYREKILRPFLNITREELEDYAIIYQVPHIEDESNQDAEAASRNLLRLQVMPLLKKLNSRAVEHIQKTANQLRELDFMLDKEAQRYIKYTERSSRCVKFSMLSTEWTAIPSPVRSRILLQLFDKLGAGRRNIRSVHLTALENLIIKGGGWADLPGDVTAHYASGQLILKTTVVPLPRKFLILNQPLDWGNYTLTLLEHQHPANQGLAIRKNAGEQNLVKNIMIAPCVPKDRLTLPGSTGARSIKRLCLDKGICLSEREKLPAVYIDGKLAAVWRLGVDTAFAMEEAEKDCWFVQIVSREARKECEEECESEGIIYER